MASSRIRMRHLRCFQAAAQHRSVTRAAEALGTVQPSVSRSLKELEADVGTALFKRSSAGLVLTDAGRTFLSFVSNGLGQIDRGFEALRGQMDGTSITAYVLPNVARMIMPGAVRRFKALYPDIDILFLPTQGGGLRQALSDASVDFGFGRLLAANHMEGMNFEYLFSEKLLFFVRTGHPLAGLSDVTVQDIDAFSVVLPTKGTIIRDEIDRFLLGRGLSRFHNQIDTLSFEFARNLMTSSDSVVCHPEGAMRRELSEGRVVPLSLGGSSMEGAVGITSPAGNPPSAAAQLLIQMIRDEVSEQGLS